MKDWPIARLGDHVRVKHGFAFQGEFFSQEGDYIVLTPGNFIESGGFKPKSGTEKYYAASPPDEFVLRRGDLVIAMTEQAQGLLGSSAIIPTDSTYLHNQRIGLVEQRSGDTDKQFLYYLFNTSGIRDQIQATATGSKVRHTAPGRVENVTVLLPPLPIQRKIAAILSAFDNLIENNSRRIRLLEEMAQRIYREWFVDFRYPGHESVPHLDSEAGPIPLGWERKQLRELADEPRLSVDPSSVEPSTPYVGLEHMPERSIAIADWGVASEAGSRKYRFQVGDVLFGKIRPYFHKVSVPPVEGICSTDAIVIRPRRTACAGLILAVVSSDAFVDQAVQTSQGTKMPRANWNVLERYPVAVPPSPLLESFDSFMSDTVGVIHRLVMSNRNLRQTRDLLLPPVMSGAIDLTELNIAIPDVAA